jgi:hypothetical protein
MSSEEIKQALLYLERSEKLLTESVQALKDHVRKNTAATSSTESLS